MTWSATELVALVAAAIFTASVFVALYKGWDEVAFALLYIPAGILIWIGIKPFQVAVLLIGTILAVVATAAIVGSLLGKYFHRKRKRERELWLAERRRLAVESDYSEGSDEPNTKRPPRQVEEG